MRKRLVSIIVVLSMLMSMAMLYAYAAGSDVQLVRIEDTSQNYSVFTEDFGKLFALDDGTDSEQVFHYDVPDGGVAVVIFFQVSNGNSDRLFNGLSSPENDVWTRNPLVNVVAIESSGADKTAVKNYMEQHDTENLVDHVFYNPNNSATARWYATLAEKNGDMSGITSVQDMELKYSYALLITEESGTRYIRHARSATSGGHVLIDYIDACLNPAVPQEPTVPTVNVTISGDLRYDYAREVASSVNSIRSSQGLSQLMLSKGLTELAMQRAAEIAINFSHTRPNGMSLSISETFINGNTETYLSPSGDVLVAAENIAAGSRTPDGVMDNWMNSPTHRSNILTASFNQIGVGCFVHDGIYYCVQLFSPYQASSSVSRDGVLPADVGIEILPDSLNLSLSEASLELNVGETATMPTLCNPNPGYADATLRPLLPAIRDASGTVIAQAAYGETGSGSIQLTAIAPGTATVALAAYEGQTDAPTLQLTVIDPKSISYAVAVNRPNYGSISVSHPNASCGTEVTITILPDDGSELIALAVTDMDGEELDITPISNTRYTFEMPCGPVTVEASFTKPGEEPQPTPEPEPTPPPSVQSFTDVSASAWYYDAVSYVYENGMMEGTGGTLFQPAVTTTRGMIVTMLYRLEGEPAAGQSTFTDVAAGAWYTSAVAWASANGIVEGYGNDRFGPDDTITREQMAAILYRYAQYKGYDVTASDGSLSGYTDAGQVSAWAQTAMVWANAKGLITGTGAAVLNPLGNASRAEVAAILMRFVENVAG